MIPEVQAMSHGPSHSRYAGMLLQVNHALGEDGSGSNGPKVEEGLGRTIESEHEGETVNRFSKLMRWILLNAGDGIQRGEITSGYYGLERRYVGFYPDPCLSRSSEAQHQRQYRRAQPAVSRALARLAARGLVELVRHGTVVKAVRLTARGSEEARALVGLGGKLQMTMTRASVRGGLTDAY